MKTKLNPNARKWIKALRSGKYKQAREKLCKVDSKGNERFCCLGVACDLFIKSGGDLESEDSIDGFRWYGSDDSSLPGAVQSWLGLSSDTGNLIPFSFGNSLAGKNDNGASFKQIADIIEKNAETLFAK